MVTRSPLFGKLLSILTLWTIYPGD